MVESEFVLLGTERDSDGVPWALLASDRDGELKFAGLPSCTRLRRKGALGEVDGSIGDGEAAAEGLAAGLCSMAAARAAGAGEASQGQGHAATRHGEAADHGLAATAGA